MDNTMLLILTHFGAFCLGFIFNEWLNEPRLPLTDQDHRDET